MVKENHRGVLLVAIHAFNIMREVKRQAQVHTIYLNHGILNGDNKLQVNT